MSHHPACASRTAYRTFSGCRALLAALVVCVSGYAAAAERDVEDAEPDVESVEDVEEITVVGVRLGSDASSIYMDAETLAGIPGTNDDPLQAIITLPGIAVNNDFEGGVAIRGTRPVDNTYRIDFMGVGYLFHFGTGSVVDGDLVEGFAFYPAGYGARYQDVIGGAIDLRTRAPLDDAFHAMLDVNLVHAGALVEGPITDGQRAYFSGRVSYFDLVLEPFIDEINEDEEDDIDLVQLPKFYDYRGRYQIDVGDKSRIDVLIDGSSDEVELLYQDTSTEVLQDPALAGGHRFALAYHRQALVYAHDAARTDARQPQVLEIGIARNVTEFGARLGGAGTVDTVVTDTSLRAETAALETERHQLELGATLSHLDVDYDVVLRDTGCTEFEVDCRFSDADTTTAEDALSLVRMRAFAEDTIRLSESLRLRLGGAFTRDDYLDESAFEPRGQLVWDWRPRTTLSVAAGRYHQLPAFEYIERNLGNPDLTYLESDHYVVGIEHLFEFGWSVKTEVYRKESRNLVTANDANRYDNRGVGEAYGVELLVRGHFGPRLIGWAALSYADARREDLDTGTTFDFAYDQPLIVSLVGKYQMNEALSFSTKAWYHSGPPHTPITGAEPDPDDPSLFLPIYGEINSERLPSYFRLDLRADWTPSRWDGVKLYFEVQNATNHRNVSGYEYEADYSSRDTVTQVPFFVSVGFRKAW